MIRVTQTQIFSGFVDDMNRTLTDLMESNMQASSQKKVNRPSDDPVGMARVLDYRSSLSNIDQYRENINTAKGWLGLADNTLVQVSNIITRARELAEQAATGTVSADNREEISYELRQLFEQLVSLSNTTYENKSIFAGHKTDGNAYEQTLRVMADDDSLSGVTPTITGTADKTIVVQFVDEGNPGGGTNIALNDPNLRFRYSTDGGRTFSDPPQAVTVDGTNRVLDLGGVQVTLPETTTVKSTDKADVTDEGGTSFMVRPTAVYLGDDESTPPEVDKFGSALNANAQGRFPGDVTVRIDNTAATGLDQLIEYSYSLDGGKNWVTGQEAFSPADATSATLVVPGGTLTLSENPPATQVEAGSQFVIRPHTAAINVEISYSEKIQINSVGKDIFGGVSKNASGVMEAAFPEDLSKNLFEVMGKLVAYAETNNQHGVQEALADLKSSQTNVMNRLASIAGRENRLNISDSVLSGLKIDETARMSQIEDVDVTELMTKLTQQQIAYQAVLKSSSMIMRMSLVNHL